MSDKKKSVSYPQPRINLSAIGTNRVSVGNYDDQADLNPEDIASMFEADGTEYPPLRARVETRQSAKDPMLDELVLHIGKWTTVIRTRDFVAMKEAS